MTPLTCRNCGAGLAPDPSARRADLLVCAHCGSVHRPPPGKPVSSPEAAIGAADPVPPRAIALPSRFEVERRDGALLVSWRKGRRAGAVFLGLFAFAWLAMASVSGALPLLVLAPLLGYYALVRGLNRVSFLADASGVRVRQGPVPWPGALRLERGAIEQLFSVEKLSNVRSGSDGRERVRVRRHYRLRARLDDGKRVDVITGLSSADQALWLERETERVLGIDDRPAEGEVRR